MDINTKIFFFEFMIIRTIEIEHESYSFKTLKVVLLD